MFIFLFMLISLILTVIGIIILRRYAGTLGLVDRPGVRKVHQKPTPMVGGVSIYFALLYCWLILQLIPHGSDLASTPMLVAMTIIFAEGIWDDQRNTKPRYRFLIHSAVAVLMALGAGTGLVDLGKMFGENTVFTGFWMIPLTVFATSGGINAYNMIDGVDGLAGSLALVSMIGITFFAYNGNQMPEVYFLVTMIGAIIGFLAFNLRTPWRKEASVFLGDSGSMLIGMLLVWSLAHMSQGHPRAMSPVLALWFFSIPLFDTVGLIIRRLLDNQSPLQADQKHIHHLLLKMGFSVNQVVAILLGISVVFMVTATVVSMSNVPDYYLFYSFLLIFVFYLIGSIKYWRIVERRELSRVNGETI